MRRGCRTISKSTRRLTVNIGLRWDMLGPLTERYNRLNYGFFPNQVNPISSQINQTQFPGFKAYGGIGFTGVNGLPRTAFNTDWNNIQPRVGAAFQLTPTTVLRGGFGISYIPQVSFGNSYGFSQSTPYVASLDANQTPAGTVSNPFPSGLLPPVGSSQGLATLLGQSPNFADASGRIGYVYSYSFGIQKQLAQPGAGRGVVRRIANERRAGDATSTTRCRGRIWRWATSRRVAIRTT